MPIFFVGEAAAIRRKIASGCYVLSEPGKKFTLLVTNFHEEGSVHFCGKKLAPGEKTACQLFVDGRNVQVGNKSFSAPAKKTRTRKGFVVEQKEQAGKMVEVTKDFHFQRVETTSSDTPNDAAAGLATIVFRICRIEEGEDSKLKLIRQNLPSSRPLNERLAKKQGRTLEVTGGIESEKTKKPMKQRRRIEVD